MRAEIACATARPEWGPGRVASAPNGGKVCVLFREAGARTLSLHHAKLERVLLICVIPVMIYNLRQFRRQEAF